MQVHLFRGLGRVFAASIDPTGSNLPLKYAPWDVFKTLDLHRGEPIPGLDVDECLDDLETYGIHVTDAHIRITQAALM